MDFLQIGAIGFEDTSGDKYEEVIDITSEKD